MEQQEVKTTKLATVKVHSLGERITVGKPESAKQVRLCLPTIKDSLRSRMMDNLQHFKEFSKLESLCVRVETLTAKGKVKKHKSEYARIKADGQEAELIDSLLGKLDILTEKLTKQIDKSTEGGVRYGFFFAVDTIHKLPFELTEKPQSLKEQDGSAAKDIKDAVTISLPSDTPYTEVKYVDTEGEKH